MSTVVLILSKHFVHTVFKDEMVPDVPFLNSATFEVNVADVSFTHS